jgi:diguanylate cyclase (GGDEF)-like protein
MHNAPAVLERRPMPENVELLNQNLTIDPDLRNFINFALESVGELGGNIFAASLASLELFEKLRNAIAVSDQPVSASLLLQDKQLLVLWYEQQQFKIATLEVLPHRETISRLCQYLRNSTATVDPEILLQRNIEMERHFDKARARAEQEMEILQQALKTRQHELLEVVHKAETDALTGLLNRRAFDEKLKQTFLHTMRQKSSPLSLLLLDLDHFKKINDKFGHQVGDEHLIRTSDILRKIIREDVDFAFRFGGDEFAVVLFADYPLACDKARQVLKSLKNKVSIGIATINQDTHDDLTLEEFIRHADNALYEAKHRGRGQVVSHFCISHAKLQCQFPCKDILTLSENV